MRVVLDTSVIVAGLRSSTGASSVVLRHAAERRFTPLMTLSLLLEYRDVCLRPSTLAATAMAAADVETVLRVLAELAEPVAISFRWRPVLPDAGDEHVLEAALNGRADVLLTHNIRHFAAGAERFALIVETPGAFLRRMTT